MQIYDIDLPHLTFFLKVLFLKFKKNLIALK